MRKSPSAALTVTATAAATLALLSLTGCSGDVERTFGLTREGAGRIYRGNARAALHSAGIHALAAAAGCAPAARTHRATSRRSRAGTWRRVGCAAGRAR